MSIRSYGAGLPRQKRQLTQAEFDRRVAIKAFEFYALHEPYYRAQDWYDACEEFRRPRFICPHAYLDPDLIRPIAQRLFDERKQERSDNNWLAAMSDLSYNYEVAEQAEVVAA